MRKKPFVPDRLPLEEGLMNQNKHIKLLIDAAASLKTYQVLLKKSKLPSKDFLRLITFQEAVQSTKIEGTQVTLTEMFEADAKGRENTVDVREAMNYYRSLMQAVELMRTTPISTRFFKQLHISLLSGNVRGSNRGPGEYRKIQNFIGAEGCTVVTASFVPPEPHTVDKWMSNLEEYIHSMNDVHELIKIAIIHAQFETIHPFLDGNGRIGRILIPLYLYDVGFIDYPNFFISETLEKDKHKYYRFLNDTRYKQDWDQWIAFFLESVKKQADKNIEMLTNVDKLYDDTLNKVNALINSTNMKKVVDALFKRPVLNVRILSTITGIDEASCRRYLAKLDEYKVLYSNDQTRNKVYYFYDLVGIVGD